MGQVFNLPEQLHDFLQFTMHLKSNPLPAGQVKNLPHVCDFTRLRVCDDQLASSCCSRVVINSPADHSRVATVNLVSSKIHDWTCFSAEITVL